jgi:hypothetical protein
VSASLAVGCSGGAVHVFDIATRACLQIVTHTHAIYTLCALNKPPACPPSTMEDTATGGVVRCHRGALLSFVADGYIQVRPVTAAGTLGNADPRRRTCIPVADVATKRHADEDADEATEGAAEGAAEEALVWHTDEATDRPADKASDKAADRHASSAAES